MGIGFDEDTGAQPLQVALQAYNFDTKEMSKDAATVERLKIPNIWVEATRSTAFASALGGMVNCVMLLYRENVLRDHLIHMEDSPERVEVAKEFKDIQTALGVPSEGIPPLVLSELVWAAPLVPGDPPE